MYSQSITTSSDKSNLNIIVPHREGGSICTFTGRQFFPLDPRPEDICIEDIAHGLSLQCRFTGQIRHFYSIAQHSVHVSESVDCVREGLMHDASEAYLSDIARPIKPFIPRYKEFEERLERVIAERFKLTFPWPPDVKEADTGMLQTEARDLLPINLEHTPWWTIKMNPYDFKIIPWSPAVAEEQFLQRFHELFN